MMTTRSPFSDDAVPEGARERPTVRGVMRPATTVEPEAHLAAAAYLIDHHHEPALVVVTDDDARAPVALITAAEITRAVARGRSVEDTRVGEVVAAVSATVEPDVAVEDAARLMLARAVRHLPVVDGGRLVGMVELADLCPVFLAPGRLPAAAGSS